MRLCVCGEGVLYSKKAEMEERGGFMAWYVYMLRCGDGSLYTGYTDDVQRRLKVHQSGKGAKYTRSRLPVELVYNEELPDKSAALRREAAIKKLNRAQKLALIEERKRGTMVEMRRKDRLLPEVEAWEVIDGSPYVTVSMIAEDGNPYAVPVNVVRDGNCIYFHGATEGRKVNCLQSGAKVCVSCVADEKVAPEAVTTRYVSAIAFGTVEPVADSVEKGTALRLLCGKYAVPAEVMKKEMAEYLPRTAVWKIIVDSITGKANRG